MPARVAGELSETPLGQPSHARPGLFPGQPGANSTDLMGLRLGGLGAVLVGPEAHTGHYPVTLAALRVASALLEAHFGGGPVPVWHPLLAH